MLNFANSEAIQMSILLFTHSIQFYVIMTVVAAAIIAVVSRPSRRSQARTFLIPGVLDQGDCDTAPSITIDVNDDGTITLVRDGLNDVTQSSAVSLAVTMIGFDVTVHERVADGYSTDPTCTRATFVLDFMATDRYHIQYIEDRTHRMAAFSLSVRPGIHTTQPLRQ